MPSRGWRSMLGRMMISSIPGQIFKSNGKRKESACRVCVLGSPGSTVLVGVGGRGNQAGREDHFPGFFESHIAFHDLFVIHENDESGHGIWRGGNKDRGGLLACLGVREIPGDQANEPTARAGIFHVGNSLELLWSTQVTHGIDELFDRRVDDSKQGNPDHGVIDPAGDLLSGPIGDRKTDEEEESERDEKPEEVVAGKAIKSPGFLLSFFKISVFAGTSEDVEGIQHPVDNGEADFVQKSENENQDPPGGQHWNDGGHARKEGFEGLANARMFDLAGLADGIDGFFGHCSEGE